MTRLLVILPLVMLVSCSATLWNRPVETWKSEWAHGKTAALLAIPYAQLKATDFGVLGSGGSFNLGQVFAQAHRWDEAHLLWERSLLNDPSPWRQAAGRALFSMYSGDRDWPQAERVAAKLVADNGNELWAQRLLFEALYFQKMDAKAQEIFDLWRAEDFQGAEATENRLFAAVLSYRAGKTDAASAGLKSLVFDEPASILHFRLESFFEEDPTRYELLGPYGKETVAFQSLSYQAVPQPLLDWLAKNKLPAAFWDHRGLVETLEALFKTETRSESGLRILEGFRTQLTGDARFAAEYARGRLYRALNRWSEARTSFQLARPLAVTPEDRLKTSWNWLNSWVQLDPSGALPAFVQVYGETTDPAYFHDVFEDWTTVLVQNRNWKLLAAVWRDLVHLLPASDRVTAGFVLARLISGDFVKQSDLGLETSAPVLLQDVITSDPFSYEAMMARAVLGQDLNWPEAPTTENLSPLQRERQKLWEGEISYGLGRVVIDEILASKEALEYEWVLKTAKSLQALDLFRPSLQLIYKYLKFPNTALTKDLAPILFPLAFRELVETQAAAQRLDPNLLFGLMREESSFDPAAKSWVGAQGLTQLMPVTAAETAKRLKMKTYDLALPADNIRIGAAYLATMVRSQEQIFLALMAYNAGGGRIKPWKVELGRLPVEIFVEAAPIAETRNYVKRILVSTVMYGVVHHGKTLGEMVKLVYPAFQP